MKRIIFLIAIIWLLLALWPFALSAQNEPNVIAPTQTGEAQLNITSLCTCSGNDADNVATVIGAGLLIEPFTISSTLLAVRVRKPGVQDFVITQIYFENSDVWLGVGAIDDGPGTLYLPNGAPSKLPAGNNCHVRSFKTNFNIVPAPPVAMNGVGQPAGEWVTVYLNVPDATAALIALGNHSARIGMHIQAFKNGGSETFATCRVAEPTPTVTPVTPTPTPTPVTPTPTPTPTQDPTGIDDDDPVQVQPVIYLPFVGG